MRQVSRAITMSAALVLLASTAGAQGAKPLTKCPVDAVVSGTVCMDKYEASAWRVPGPTTINKGLVKKIQQGKETIADLTKGGATLLGTGSDNYAPCGDSGQNCGNDIYAVSLPGVQPSRHVTWFQAQAALTTGGCLAQKRAAWGNLRKCQAVEEAKQLRGKTGDLAKCQTQFQGKLAKISAKAAAKAVACRYGDNGDGTVTDYETGLQWERKTDDGSVHDKDNNGYMWCLGPYPNCTNPANPPDGTAFTAFQGTLNNGTSSNGSATIGCFAGHCDWRLPAIEELAGIVDCNQGSPCIDQTVFGPTVASFYWSASTNSTSPNTAWGVSFGNGDVFNALKIGDNSVRAVRSGL